MTQIPRARRSPVPLDRCSLAKAVELIGDRWTLLILRSALFGVRRFDDFQTELGAPRTVLSGRLKKLSDDGLLDKQGYKEPGKRTRNEYILSEKGEASRPILIALTQWGDDWLNDGDAPISFSAKGRGRVRAGFVDEEGRGVALSDMRPVLRR